jgi:hypothetical protein
MGSRKADAILDCLIPHHNCIILTPIEIPAEVSTGKFHMFPYISLEGQFEITVTLNK